MRFVRIDPLSIHGKHEEGKTRALCFIPHVGPLHLAVVTARTVVPEAA